MLPIVVRRNAGQIQRRIPQFFRLARRARRAAPYTVPPAAAAAASYALRNLGRRGANTRNASSRSGMQLQSGFNPSSIGGRKRLGMYRKRRSRNPKRARRRRKFAQKVYAIANNTGQTCDIKLLKGYNVTNDINKTFYHEIPFLRTTEIEDSYSKTKRLIVSGGTAAVETPYLETSEAAKTKYNKGFHFTTFRNNDPSKASAKLQVTWYSCKENTDFTPTQLWVSDMNRRDGLLTTTLPDLNNPLWNIRQPIPGGVLFKYWKQTRQANYELTGGDSCTVSMRRRSPFNYVKTEATTAYIKGVSQMAVVRIIGNIVHDQTDHTQVGFAKVTLDCILQGEDSWCMDKTSDKKHHIYLKSTSADLGTVVAEEAVVEDNAVMT